MTDTRKENGRLVILAGPSCVGKSPLAAALGRLHPGLAERLRPLVLHNSRPPRPGEVDGVDYHFRTRVQIGGLRERDGFVVMEVRGDLQALDVGELVEALHEEDVFFEGNPVIGRILQTHPELADVDRLSVFLSPLSREEIRSLRDASSGLSFPDVVTDVMRRKLLRRTRRQKGELSLPDLENIEKRAASAPSELREGHHFQHVIPNHDGEDSENWDAFYYPLGDARLALQSFVSLLQGEPAPRAEQWEEDLIPREGGS